MERQGLLSRLCPNALMNGKAYDVPSRFLIGLISTRTFRTRSLLKNQSGISPRTFGKLRDCLHLIGVEQDVALAERAGISRLTLHWIRAALSIPPAPRLSTEQEAECLRRIRACEPLRWISAGTGIGRPSVRALATNIGWDRSWTSHHKRSPTTHIGRLSRALLIFRLKNSRGCAS